VQLPLRSWLQSEGHHITDVLSQILGHVISPSESCV
jgi:hypothetical protein